MRPITISEIGWNFIDDLDLAKKMIKAAAESGADYAKFQTWSVSRLKAGPWDTDGRREIYETAELSEDDHRELIDYCGQVGIKFMSSVFSLPDAMLLKKLKVKAVKIPSFESRNRELIEFCVYNFDKVFMSTGTSRVDEIASSISEFSEEENITLMHCVSSYPCNYDQGNLPKMNRLKTLGFPVGYSDHIMGVESAKIAIGEGATVIEKHFTIDRGLPGRDNQFAILPHELKDLTDYINNREKMLSNHPDVQDSEMESREKYTGRFNG